MKDALSKSATIGLKAARNNVKRESGALAKSLKKRARTYGRGSALVMVGPDRKFTTEYRGKKRRPVKYAHLVEFGHKVVRGGKVVGHVPPKPFLRPAFDSKKEDMKKKYADEIGKALQRHAERVARKNKRRR